MSKVESHGGDSEINLLQFFSILWKKKWWILAGTAIAGTIAVFVSLRLPNMYTAQAVINPIANGKQGGVASLAGQFGDLASLAGVSLTSGGGGVDVATLAIETIKSRAFITEFIQRHDLLVPLMGTKGWSHENQAWIIDDTKYDEATQRWIRKVKPPLSVTPSDWEVYKKFSDLFEVSQDKKTQIIRISISSMCPPCAKDWVSWIVNDLNEYLRKKDVAEAGRSMEFLKKQLEITSVAQMQTIIYQLIEEQTKTIMLAAVRDGYVFHIIDPAVTPEDKTGPKRAIIVIMAVLSGLLFSIFGVLVARLFSYWGSAI